MEVNLIGDRHLFFYDRGYVFKIIAKGLWVWMKRPLKTPTQPNLAFEVRSSRIVDEVDLRVCLSAASYAAAEKAERRMALKI